MFRWLLAQWPGSFVSFAVGGESTREKDEERGKRTQVAGSELKSPRKIRTRYVWWRICLGARMLAMYSRYLIGAVLVEASDAAEVVR